ncbi:hypothetical protein LCI18_008875 [Fusarium solani-melongenae]|uniref:Uncharacterized protein n=1 Tax=Fusarium solani subsp. cucurbitae TaxID=2747967 RepID=A0ACD3Z9M5_FUSSC|nr:hypothetical protein LCI18_008875 [Fusarium solani-melongenae]
MPLLQLHLSMSDNFPFCARDAVVPRNHLHAVLSASPAAPPPPREKSRRRTCGYRPGPTSWRTKPALTLKRRGPSRLRCIGWMDWIGWDGRAESQFRAISALRPRGPRPRGGCGACPVGCGAPVYKVTRYSGSPPPEVTRTGMSPAVLGQDTTQRRDPLRSWRC